MNVVDQIARDAAMRAIAMIETHEKVCAERARESITWRGMVMEKMDSYFSAVHIELRSVSDTIKTLYGRMWFAMIGLFSVLITAIGFLIAHHGL